MVLYWSNHWWDDDMPIDGWNFWYRHYYGIDGDPNRCDSDHHGVEIRDSSQLRSNMISKILVTNNTDGNHPADTWAMAAAESVADVSGLTGNSALEAQRLQLKFADILEKHFIATQDGEKMKLALDPAHVLTNIKDHMEADLVMIAQELECAARGTAWEFHYMLPEVQGAVMTELKHLFHSTMHTERLVHCDKNPNCQHAAAYKAAYHGVK